MSEPAQSKPAVDSVPAVSTGEEGAPTGPSKSELKKRAKDAEKARKAAEREAKEEEERQKRAAADAVDNAVQNYGKQPLHQSQERTGRERLKFTKLGKKDVGKEVIFRARLHNLRPQGMHCTSRHTVKDLMELIWNRSQDCILAISTTDRNPPGCHGRLWRQGRASGIKADAQVLPDHTCTSYHSAMLFRIRH